MRNKERIKPFLKWIEKEWLKSPDLRFGQLLVNKGIISDSPYNWTCEMQHYLLPFEAKREIFCWGVLTKGYENIVNWKDGGVVKAPKHKYIPICKLETTHIKNILRTQKQIKETYMENLLKEELKYRKKNKIK